MRIGELLVEQRKLRANDLTRALAEKPSDKRLTSFLIAKGLVDFDDASRALGEQRGFACALAKHIAGRDPELARLIPPDLGRASCVLPIGRSSKGAVIVCARDPAPALLAQLQAAIRGEVLMVITPATRLESLVAEAYGKASTGEFDIDFDLANDLPAPTPSRVTRGPLPTPPMPFDAVDPKPTGSPNQYPRAETPPPLPPLPDMSALDPESIRYSLTSLDDYRVTRDPAQSGQIPIGGGTLPPANKPVTTPPLNVLAGSPTTISRSTPPTSPPSPHSGLAPGTYPPKRTNALDAVPPKPTRDLNPPTPLPSSALNPPTSPPKRTNALDAAGPPAPTSGLAPPTSPPAPTSALNPATSPPKRTTALDGALAPPTSPPAPTRADPATSPPRRTSALDDELEPPTGPPRHALGSDLASPTSPQRSSSAPAQAGSSRANAFDTPSALDDIDLAPSSSWQRRGGASQRGDDSDMALGRWTPTGTDAADPPTSPPARASAFDPETSPPRRAEPFELPPPSRAIDPATRPPARASAFDPDTSPPRRASAVDPPTSPLRSSGAFNPDTSPARRAGAVDPPTSPPRSSSAFNPDTSPRRASAVDPPTSPPRPTDALKPPTSPPRPTDALKPPTSPPKPTDALKPPTSPPKRTVIDPDTSPPKHRSLFTTPTSPPKLSGPAGAASTPSPSASLARPTTVEAMQAALDSATTREAATDIVLSYVATRWNTGLVLAIRATTAIGYRGHGVTSPESVTVSLGSPSTVQRAVMTREVSTEAPSGVGQTALVHALGGSRAPTAAPVIVGGQPVAVIAVSEPKEGPPVLAAPQLADIADALGSAYKRIMSR